MSKRNRSAVTGRFTTTEEAAADPEWHVAETVERRSGAGVVSGRSGGPSSGRQTLRFANQETEGGESDTAAPGRGLPNLSCQDISTGGGPMQ